MSKNKALSGPERLSKAIGKRRGSRQQAALSMGMMPSQLSPILHGRRRPTLDQALAIAHYFGVPIESWAVRK